MRRTTLGIVGLLLLASLLLAACGQAPASTKVEPAKVEALDDKLSRVTLTAKAAERTGIETATVRSEAVSRSRTVGGIVQPVADAMMVQVPRDVIGSLQVAMDQPATVTPLEGEMKALTARTVADSDWYYFALDDQAHGLMAGQRVQVQFAMAGSGADKLVVPYSSVLYDLEGNTWVYTVPQALTYERRPITVEYIEGEDAVLMDGPPAGTTIVSVGVAELYGTEFGVGK